MPFRQHHHFCSQMKHFFSFQRWSLFNLVLQWYGQQYIFYMLFGISPQEMTYLICFQIMRSVRCYRGVPIIHDDHANNHRGKVTNVFNMSWPFCYSCSNGHLWDELGRSVCRILPVTHDFGILIRSCNAIDQTDSTTLVIDKKKMTSQLINICDNNQIVARNQSSVCPFYVYKTQGKIKLGETMFLGSPKRPLCFVFSELYKSSCEKIAKKTISCQLYSFCPNGPKLIYIWRKWNTVSYRIQLDMMTASYSQCSYSPNRIKSHAV